MSSSLIIDNWLLQDIGGCLSEGLNPEASDELLINKSEDSHSIREVSSAGIQLEALLEFLVNIVLRDSIIFDADFTDAWAEYEEKFRKISQPGLMRSLPFRSLDKQLKEPKQFALDLLCVTSSLREAQKRNEKSWSAGQGADNPYMSQVIWGTAGMLSRSHVCDAHYSGHPLRKRIIEQSIFATSRPDVVSETQNWMAEERLRIFEIRDQKSVQKTAILVLPPVAIEIIEESKDIADLIHVAYQLREKYAKMREWMKSIQMAFDSENSEEIAKYKKTLNAVSKDIDRAMGTVDTGKISLKIGLGLPSLSIPIMDIHSITRKFGMRAMLNNQIFSPRGEKSIKKLLRMFGEESSRLGLSAQDYLRARPE